jgi:hypothetical protein
MKSRRDKILEEIESIKAEYPVENDPRKHTETEMRLDILYDMLWEMDLMERFRQDPHA